MAQSFALGIDLGTTHSCMGVWRDGQVEIIPDAEGNRLWPSTVAFTDRGRRFGAAAQPTPDSAGNPAGTVLGAKRFLGRHRNDPGLQRDAGLLAVSVAASDEEEHAGLTVSYAGRSRDVSPLQLCAMLLARMKARAEEYVGGSVAVAVLTVPASFTQQQRRLLQDAAAVAGLPARRLTSDGGAAALAWLLKKRGRSEEPERPVLFLDLGGGGLTASLSEFDEGVVEVAAVTGDPGVGGIHFDARLVQHCRSEFRRRHGVELGGSPRAMARLRAACERAKRELSAASQATISLEELAGGHSFVITIARSEFEEMCEDLLQRCTEAVDRVLELACMTPADVAEVVLLGGCSRVHAVRRRVLARFSHAVLCGLHADEAVAVGATVQAALMAHLFDDLLAGMLLLDAYPLAVSVGRPGSNKELVIPPSTTIPTAKFVELAVDDPRQTELLLTVYETHNDQAAFHTPVASCELEGLPPPPVPGATRRVKVCLGFCADGLLEVKASDVTLCTTQAADEAGDEAAGETKGRDDCQAVPLSVRGTRAPLSPAHLRRLRKVCERFDAEDARLLRESNDGNYEEMKLDEAEGHPQAAHEQRGTSCAPPIPGVPAPAAAAASEALWCPITNQPISDPVKASDGHSYERMALTGWIAGQRALGQAPRSPVTGAVLQLYGAPAGSAG